MAEFLVKDGVREQVSKRFKSLQDKRKSEIEEAQQRSHEEKFLKEKQKLTDCFVAGCKNVFAIRSSDELDMFSSDELAELAEELYRKRNSVGELAKRLAEPFIRTLISPMGFLLLTVSAFGSMVVGLLNAYFFLGPFIIIPFFLGPFIIIPFWIFALFTNDCDFWGRIKKKFFHTSYYSLYKKLKAEKNYSLPEALRSKQYFILGR